MTNVPCDKKTLSLNLMSSLSASPKTPWQTKIVNALCSPSSFFKRNFLGFHVCSLLPTPCLLACFLVSSLPSHLSSLPDLDPSGFFNSLFIAMENSGFPKNTRVMKPQNTSGRSLSLYGKAGVNPLHWNHVGDSLSPRCSLSHVRNMQATGRHHL